MEIEKDEKRYYKLKLCNLYQKNGKCYRGDNCNYAHGKDDLKEFKKICNFGLKCHKEDCKFAHPDDWNPDDNKKICEYYINGFCKNEDRCNFKHIEDDIKDNNKINEKNDQENQININHINELIEKEEYKNNIEEKINSNFDIFINGIKYSDNIEENNKNNGKMDKDINSNGMKYNDEDNKENIEEYIIKLQNDFEKYTKEIKNNINILFIDDKYKYGIDMKSDLNKIMAEISLFKYNYQDIINHYNN